QDQANLAQRGHARHAEMIGHTDCPCWRGVRETLVMPVGLVFNPAKAGRIGNPAHQPKGWLGFVRTRSILLPDSSMSLMRPRDRIPMLLASPWERSAHANPLRIFAGRRIGLLGARGAVGAHRALDRPAWQGRI